MSVPDDPAQLWARARVMQPAGTPPHRLPTAEEMGYLRIVAASVCAVPASDQQKAPNVEPLKYGASEAEPMTQAQEMAQTQAKKEAGEQLNAAMPFWLQTADPAKLAPAIEAAKAAGVAASTVASAESKLGDALSKAFAAKQADAAHSAEAKVAAKLKEMQDAEREEVRARREAERQLASAMHKFPLQRVQTSAELALAIEAAKQAGVAAELVDTANVKLQLLRDQEAEKEKMAPPPRTQAEGELRAAIPYPLQTADPAQLALAIEAAKAAGVAAPIVAKAEAKLHDAEAKLHDSLSRQAGDGLRASMPYPWEATDPARLKSAIEAAKASGVAEEKVVAAEARLKEAEEKASRADFDKHDRNNSGKLDHKELRMALASAGLIMDSEEAMALLSKYDEDRSGLLEFDEFQRLQSALNSPNPSLTPAVASQPAATAKVAEPALPLTANPPIRVSTDTEPLLGKLMSSTDDLPGLLRKKPTEQEMGHQEKGGGGDLPLPVAPALVAAQAAGGEYVYYEDDASALSPPPVSAAPTSSHDQDLAPLDDYCEEAEPTATVRKPSLLQHL